MKAKQFDGFADTREYEEVLFHCQRQQRVVNPSRAECAPSSGLFETPNRKLKLAPD